MFKNVASQKVIVFAYDYTTGAPKTGDAANLTAYVSKDYGSVTVLGDTSATEMDTTNAPGSYMFDLTQSETNADCLYYTGKSSTSNIRIVPQTIYTLPASFTASVAQTGDAYGALTGAQAEPGQASPASNETPLVKISYLFKAWRNLVNQTATAYKLFNDDGVTVGQKATVADDGTTFSRTKIVTGP